MTNITSDHLNLYLLQIQLLLFIIYLSISFNFGCTGENVDILKVPELEIAPCYNLGIMSPTLITKLSDYRSSALFFVFYFIF